MSGKKILVAITKINVQKQLSIIFFIAIFIPVISIGNYLVYNTRSLLFNHYEDQSRSDNLRVKSLLLDLTSNIYIKAESLSSDKELIQLLSTVYTSPEESIRAIENYKGFETLYIFNILSFLSFHLVSVRGYLLIASSANRYSTFAFPFSYESVRI